VRTRARPPSRHPPRPAPAPRAAGGGQAGASGGDKNAIANGSYRNGVAIFTIAKGGLMYDAVVAGQKFSFTPGSGA